MFCKRCGRETSGGAIFCDTCEKIVYGVPEPETKAEKVKEKQSLGTSASIYKFLCVCMGLCLIAASVAWAAIFMRDRMDSPAKQKDSSPALEALADETPETEEKSKTTTTTVTTTTTTTTTTDPYKQSVLPKEIMTYGTLFTIADSTQIRIGPGYDYERIDRVEIPSGTGLDIVGEELDLRSGETWCYISYDDTEGWVPMNVLSSKSPVIAAVLPDEYYYGSERKDIRITRMGGLNLYSGPGESYEVIMKLNEDDTVTKEGYNYFSVKWSYVSIGDQYGWIKTYDGDWFNPTIE